MSSYGSGKSGFSKALEKGTAAILLEPDWDAILAICDLINGIEVKPKFAVDNISKKISQDNPTVAKFALQILESVVKNCGPKIHAEVANASFMEFMKNQSKLKLDSVREKILELIQCWSHAFKDNSDYRAVGEVYNSLKNEGVSFPVLREVDANFSMDGPPEWKDGDNCFSCRTEFGILTRKHHCRACGQIFCSKCSSKTSLIPKFGIEKEVRVCDSCFIKLNPGASSSATPSASSTSKESDSDLPSEYLNSALYKQSLEDSKSKPAPGGGKSKEEIEEEEQLQLALAISQSEAEAKAQEKKKRQSFMSLDATPPGGNPEPVSMPSGPKMDLDENLMAPELQKYLNRNYWEQKNQENAVTKQSAPGPQQSKISSSPAGSKVMTSSPSVTQPSAPPSMQSEPNYSSITTHTNEHETYQNGGLNAVNDAAPPAYENNEERDDFMTGLSSSIDVFVNRMNSNSARGRSIINDSAVQTLFATLQNMHPQLLQYLQAQEDKRSTTEGLQDKLAQLRDARDALTSLRQEHEEKRRIEAEERAKRKQIQMMQKLDILRKHKQQVLDRQGMEAMQRLQHQQAEMQARMELQKQQTQMRQMQLHGFPQELQQQTGGYGGQYNPMIPGGDYSQMSQYNPAAAAAAPQMAPPQNMSAGMGPAPSGMMSQTYQPGVPMEQQVGGGIPAPGHAGANMIQSMPPQYSGGYDQMQQQPQQPGMAPGQIPQGYQGQTGGYNPAAQAPGQQQAPGYPGYQQPAPQGNSMYNPYNMHGMAESLPQAGQAPPTYQSVMQQPGQPQYPGAPGMGGQLPPSQDMQQQQGVYNPQQPQMGGAPPAGPPQYQQYQQQAPPPPQQNDSQLISFD